jgi:2-polyprenyl-3-methyl-5-hydroxy-6-metoxy-1,4-benzoquinol methylase
VKNEEFYGQAYQDPEFVRVYQETRNALYQRIAGIIRALGDTYALDIGCSLGLLVDHLHRQGISSWGLDFDLPQLREAHAGLSCSQNFFYGDAAELNLSIPTQGSAIILLDTLRYVEDPQKLGRLGAQHLIIKEVSPNPVMRHLRRNENDGTLYTPARLARLFPAYRLERLYGSRFLFSVSRPSPATLAILSWMPTYTALLARR